MVNHIVTGTTVSPGESNINLLADGKHYFVDKTLTINQFLTGPPHQLVLRPRRCGKSHAISLLRTFLKASSPDEVRPATLQAPFTGTLIDGEGYKDLVKEHYKVYPVLHMNLKVRCDLTTCKSQYLCVLLGCAGLSLDEMHKGFISSLRTSLQFCRDQLKHKKLNKTSLYGDLCELIDQQGNWLNKLVSAPLFITRALHDIYGRPAIVLVDEYEAPLNHAIQHNYLTPASEFFGVMFSLLLKDNKHVQRSFMVGVLKLVKSDWLSGLNNVKGFPLNTKDPRYGDSFLFTEEEVQEFLLKTDISNSPFRYVMLSKLPCFQSSLQLADLKDFYNSYYARGPGAKSISLFNPWSVHNAIAEGQLACYWNQTSSYMPIRKAIWNRGPEFTDRLTKLLAGEEVKLAMNDTVTYEDLDTLEEKDLWGLLYYAGYLTPAASLEHGPSTYFRIPNVELRQEWVGWLREFIEENEKESFKDIKKLLDPFLQGDAAEAQKAFPKILLEHFSYFLFDASLPDKAYQAFLFGLLLSDFGGRPGSYVVDVEKGAGYGRYNIRCWPIFQYHQIEIIIELKAVSLSKKSKNNKRVKKTKEELEKHMDQQSKITMDRLNSREYYRKSHNYVTTVHEFGICFAGKLCVAGSRTRKRDGTGWTVKDHPSPGAQFRKSEVSGQEYDLEVEEKLEEEEKREDRGAEPMPGSSSHHDAMEIEPTGATRKRNFRQRKDEDSGSSNTGSRGQDKRRKLSGLSDP